VSSPNFKLLPPPFTMGTTEGDKVQKFKVPTRGFQICNRFWSSYTYIKGKRSNLTNLALWSDL